MVATWHFHVFQQLRAWVFNKMQHSPSFPSNKRATHIVPLVKGAPPHVTKPTAYNIWNHVRGVLSIRSQTRQKFHNTAVENLRWQLTQATTAADRTWVLDAMARHSHVAPRKRPREPSPPTPMPVSPPSKAHEIPAIPWRGPNTPPPRCPSCWWTTTSTRSGKCFSVTRNKRCDSTRRHNMRCAGRLGWRTFAHYTSASSTWPHTYTVPLFVSMQYLAHH